MEKVISKILAPITPEEFRDVYYTKQSLLIKNEGKRFDWLFGWSSLNQILNQSFFPHPTMKVVLEGKPINDISEKSKVIEWCRKGATVIIDQLQHYDPQVRRFVASLSREIGEPINANLYFSQPGRQAFNIHYDHHDVIILQIQGLKRWKVYEDSEDTQFPLFVQKNHSSNTPDIPILDCILSPGDVLYIPRGHWHAATAKDEQSLHLTIGIDARTGVDFATWLANELRDNISFRKCFPLIFNDEINDNKNYHILQLQHFENLRNILIHKLKNDKLFDDYTRHCLITSKSIEPFYFPWSTNTSELIFSKASLLKRDGNQRFLLESNEDKDTITLTIQEKYHRFIYEAEPLLKFIFSKTEFSFKEALEVSEISESDVSDILEHLLSESLIQLV
ncbi:hypothetical protein FD724_38660 (plasmid) [Nostoc sp. C057]|uniref:cupin domain-containing protein n=1 Tax=Nostoc sp. C057 TaxID=2576903 RepID=UPI0015C35EEB|nr:cupin domain-containing protein [Nostoc sp. C057]QLE53768.1 hypothetical protein FD724_38660 [Nostoc sp. C057]